MEAAARILFQRAGGWCEPVQDRAFPLPESVVKAARVVSYIVRFKRSQGFFYQRKLVARWVATRKNKSLSSQMYVSKEARTIGMEGFF